MCERVDLGNGNVAIVCGGHRRPAKCEFCKQRPHTKLCDFPVDDGKTCDAKICDSCATPAAADLDHCPKHSGKPRVTDHESQVTKLHFPATAAQLKAAGWKPLYSRGCKQCHSPLEFWETANGKLMPLEAILIDGAWMLGSHWASCPFADKFRKAEAKSAEKQLGLFGAEKK